MLKRINDRVIHNIQYEVTNGVQSRFDSILRSKVLNGLHATKAESYMERCYVLQDVTKFGLIQTLEESDA